MNKKNNISKKLRSSADKLLGMNIATPEQVHKSAVRGRKVNISVKLAVFIVVAAIAAVALLSISVLKNNKSQHNLNAKITQTSNITQQNESLNTNLLIVLSKTSHEDLIFLARLALDSENGVMNMYYIPANEYAMAAGLTSTLSGHFNKGGINQLKQALISKEDFAPARYIHLSEEQLTNLYALSDDFEINIENDIAYLFDGISIVLESGEGVRTPDTLMKYTCYLAENIEGNEEKLLYLFKQLAANFFEQTPEGSTQSTSQSTQPGDNESEFLEFFAKIVNNIDTDISSADAQNFEQIANNLYFGGAMENMQIMRNGEEND